MKGMFWMKRRIPQAFAAVVLSAGMSLLLVGTALADPPGATDVSPQMLPICPPDCGGSTSRILEGVYARQQYKSYYCGPASAQVILDFIHDVVDPDPNGQNGITNWKKQTAIAVDLKTDDLGMTNRGPYENLLNDPDYGAKPAGLTWKAFSALSGGDKLYSKITKTVGTYGKPLPIAVLGYVNAQTHLTNWGNCGGYCKHWIAIYGYDGLWDGSDNTRVFYADSAWGAGTYQLGAAEMWSLNDANAGSGVSLTPAT
jgi:hypothetical protein